MVNPPYGFRAVIAAALFAAAGSSSTSAQEKHLLQIHPRQGDTLHMHMEQRTEVVNASRAATEGRSVSTILRIWSRAIVGARLGSAVSVLAITDSAAVATSDESTAAAADQMRRMFEGQRVAVRLAPDGTARLLDGGSSRSGDASDLVALIPAALPSQPLAVGDSWVREMPMPIGRGAEEGSVKATFRLDSLSRGGDRAYISVRGELSRDSVPAGPPRGAYVRMDGSLSGALVLDRRRGWLMDSRFAIVLNSTLVTPASSGAMPMRFQTTITQRTRTTDRK
jgi:hypothetical protein